MRYYLSYIEVRGHAALMLSEEQPDGRCKVIEEVGFLYAPGTDGGGLLFAGKGYLQEEVNASKALYSASSQVKHRTFEVSIAEKNEFLNILKRDKAINAVPMLIPAAQNTQVEAVIGGPNYQYFLHNCKTYALGVLKQIGIIESDNLRNTLSPQRPNTTENLLTRLTNQEMSCPDKDKLIQDITNSFKKLNSLLDNLLSKANNETHKKYIQSVKTHCNRMLDLTHSIGFKADFFASFGSLLNTFEKISDPRQYNDQFSEFQEKLKECQKELVDLKNTTKEVYASAIDKQLGFYWKKTPPLAKRVHLDKFTELEKTIYLTTVKKNEVSDGLTLMLSELETLLASKSIEKNQNLRDDLETLQKLLAPQKKILDENNQAFLKKLSQCESNGSKEEEKLAIYREHNQKLGESVKSLESIINNFTPKSSETNRLLQFFKSLIAYFSKNFITIEKTVSHIKKEMNQWTRENPETFFKPKNPPSQQQTQEQQAQEQQERGSDNIDQAPS